MTRPADSATDPVPPACRATVDRLQLALDGALDPAALDSDPHPAVCPACRERIAAARLVLSALAAPPEPVPLPAGLTDGILSAVCEDRQARLRQRAYAVAVAACVAFVASALLLNRLGDSPEPIVPAGPHTQVANGTPNPGQERAPEPRPVRLGEELSKAGQALRDSSRPLTEPAAAAPEFLAVLTDALTRPALPAAEFEPARRSLAELPEAARSGLEPVTGTAQKAFSRLMRDIGGVGTKPKS